MRLTVQIKKQLEHMMLDVDFTVEDEVFALLGVSGAGKSMTLKCIAGIETPDSGRIALDDRILFDSERGINLPARERGVGYLFQEYALFPHMKVEQSIQLVTRDREATKKLISRFGLEEIKHRYPSEISGGQKQRAALARMLAARPKVILLDEPFSALDVQRRAEVVRTTEKMIRETDAITILVTHHYDEVGRIANSVACLNQGRTQETQKVQDFFMNPKTITAFLLLGGKNIVACRPSDGGQYLDIVDWEITVPFSDSCDWIGVWEDGFTLKPQKDCVEISVSRTEVEEDVFHWYLYAYPQSGAEKPICCKFSKEELRREALYGIHTIYMRLDRIYYLLK